MSIPDEVLRFFGGKLRMGYLATLRPDGFPAVVPLGVMIHDGQVRISSPSETFKLRNLRRDPHLAVCIPDPDDARRYLMIRGTAELAEDGNLAMLDWLAREHMGLEQFPDRKTARTVITIRPERFLFGGTHEA
ncbi:MAG: TIGR03618 family F420-dependent PPOX class oxidoreductase [Novosphingobium sp.]